MPAPVAGKTLGPAQLSQRLQHRRESSANLLGRHRQFDRRSVANAARGASHRTWALWQGRLPELPKGGGSVYSYLPGERPRQLERVEKGRAWLGLAKVAGDRR